MVKKSMGGINVVFILMAIYLCAVMTITSGCEPLRKKFIREKKKNSKSSSFVPVFEPVDYPSVVHSPKDLYSQHYSLWKVWQRDFVQGLNDSASDKHQKYTLAQAIAQLEEMKKWIVDDKRKQLDPLINGYHAIESELDKPAGIRNSYSLQRKFESISKEIQDRFKPKAMESSFVPST